MITRKAAVGFILLAVIVFAVSSYDTAHSSAPKADTIGSTRTSDVVIQKDNLKDIPTVRNDTLVYKPPLVDFGKNLPLAMTAMVEAFAFICYLVAKKIEPAIIEWEKTERERVAGERVHDEADTEEPDKPDADE